LGIAIVLTAQLMFILDATVLTSATMAALAGLTGLVALATRRRRTEVALAA
jgi:MYXO-CTERM domain-containing protein